MNSRGFTLIEILVVVAIIGLIISVGLTLDLNSFKRDIFHSEESIILSLLEKARSRSMTNYYQTTHGLCYIAPNYVIFRGTTCTAVGSEISPANAVVASASNFSTTFPTIVFTQLTGTTTAATIHITDGVKSADIILNNEGTINW